MLVVSACIFVVGSIVVQPSATAGQFFFAMSPKKQIAVHDFGEEHAHLADSVYDTINPLVLAALPRGRAYVEYRAPSKCIPGSLRSVLARVSAKFGPITVNSTYRSPGKNRKVGGRGKSMHLSCRAVDFRVHGSTRGLVGFLLAQSSVGGYNRYPSGFYHIDNGPRRTW
jgi:Peptidase M15